MLWPRRIPIHACIHACLWMNEDIHVYDLMIVCLCMYIYDFTHVCFYDCMYIYENMYGCVWMNETCVCKNIWMCMSVFMCTNKLLLVCVCTYNCMYSCECVWINVNSVNEWTYIYMCINKCTYVYEWINVCICMLFALEQS